jgi:membrane protein
MFGILRLSIRAALDAYYAFLHDDGWAIASHIALSALMALFPFLILVTTLAASFFGSKDLAEQVAALLLETWPEQVARPIAAEIHNVLTTTRSDILTVGAALSLYFASSGIESLRIGLNRAYDMAESRHWLLLRLESIAYVLIGAVALIALSFFVILGPLIFNRALRYAPWIAPFENMVTFARLGAATLVLIMTLVVTHLWLPAGRRRLWEITPGVVATLLLWLAGGLLFGRYLAEFAETYVTYYAGLASAMIALVFLYYSACIFLYGGELNAVLRRHREFGETLPEK